MLANGILTIDSQSRLLLFNNYASQGGGISMYSLYLKFSFNATAHLISNTATDVGGAIYALVQPSFPCFYYITAGDFGLSIVELTNNSAVSGVGNHIYGGSLKSTRCDFELVDLFSFFDGGPFCLRKFESFVQFDLTPHSFSSISSEPQRVCLCDSSNVPQCTNLTAIFFEGGSIHPGDTVTVNVVVAGLDFGTTTGRVQANFLNPNTRTNPNQWNQLIENVTECSQLKYTVYSESQHETLCLQTSQLQLHTYGNMSAIKSSINAYENSTCIDDNLLTTPVFINFTILPCPPGFYLSDSQRCECYSVLTTNGFDCQTIGYISWEASTMWISATTIGNESTIFYNQFCPPDYCKSGLRTIKLGPGDNSTAQCAFNHAGTLCGGCRENYSIALGSAKCVKCASLSHTFVLIIFPVFGILLVLLILTANLTITQGLINSLIFYTNVIQTYKGILYSTTNVSYFQLVLHVFIAWSNLDFGIETCIGMNLNTYWKTWMQFLFPLHIWAIAGLIILLCRHSIRLTQLVGNRAVPLLVTLFLLSYMKLFRVIVDTFAITRLETYPNGSVYAVWYLDGNLAYCAHPHIYLFVAAFIALIFLWLPYTLLLIVIQWLRRISHLKFLSWINRFIPVFDAHFAPLKHRYHYWFGVFLLVRGTLLVVFTLTSAVWPTANLLVLLVFMIVLLSYISAKRVYQSKSLNILDGFTFFNLSVLSAAVGILSNHKAIFVYVSMTFAFIQFWFTLAWSVMKPCVSRIRCKRYQNQDYDDLDSMAD